MTPNVMEKYLTKNWCIYILGTYEFENTANSKNYIFKYAFRIITNPKYDVQVVTNTITPIVK